MSMVSRYLDTRISQPSLINSGKLGGARWDHQKKIRSSQQNNCGPTHSHNRRGYRFKIVTLTYEREATMLAMIAMVLIVLWLLGLLAFHVTSGFIHVALVVGLVLLVLHFLRGSRATI
jgi:hypothetical protein